MFRVFACLGNQRFKLVRITRSAASALRFHRSGGYLVSDPSGGCYDEAELANLAAEEIFSDTALAPTGRMLITSA